MPGRHRLQGAGEAPLSRGQSAIASRVIKRLWNAEMGAPDDRFKDHMLREINADFVRQGHGPIYSGRKLADAISNRLYTHRLAQRKARPTSWTGQGGAGKKRAVGDGCVPMMQEPQEPPMPPIPEAKDERPQTPQCDVLFGLPMLDASEPAPCSAAAPAGWQPSAPAAFDRTSAFQAMSPGDMDMAWDDNIDLSLLPSPPETPLQSPEQTGAVCDSGAISPPTDRSSKVFDDIDALLESATGSPSLSWDFTDPVDMDMSDSCAQPAPVNYFVGSRVVEATPAPAQPAPAA